MEAGAGRAGAAGRNTRSAMRDAITWRHGPRRGERSTSNSRASSGADAPRRFEIPLRRLARELDLPYGPKVAVLAELESDLEGLYRHLRSRGMAESEAVREAGRRLTPDGETVRRLVRIHSRGWHRLAHGLSNRVRRRVEYGVLAAAALLALLGAAVAVRGAPTFASPDPLLWTVLALGGSVLAAGAVAATHLFVLRRWSPGLARDALPAFGLLGGSALALGLVGGLVRLRGALVGRSTGALGEVELVTRLGREATLAATSLCVAFAAGAVGFLVVNRIQALREEDVARLL